MEEEKSIWRQKQQQCLSIRHKKWTGDCHIGSNVKRWINCWSVSTSAQPAI